jgi:DNA-binding LytR/AlgR family response regulator
MPSQSEKLVKILEAHQYEIVGIAQTNQEALELFFANKVDILIIDIYLDGSPDGISFAETINNVPNAARPFVFLTNTTDRAIFDRAKLTNPFSFLLKPFNELELLYSLELAVEKFYGQTNVFNGSEQNTVVSNEYLFIKKKEALKKVRIADITFIEVEERYCTINTLSDKFVIHISLAKVSELLDEAFFGRTHRNYLVNMNMIEEIQSSINKIVLTNGSVIPMSENYREFLQRFRTLR